MPVTSSAPGVSPGSDREVDDARSRVLVVDDDASLAEMLSIVLRQEGFDCAVRVGDMPDSSLVSLRLADNRRLCVATPGYLARHGRPQHPSELARFDCLTLSSDASQTRG